MQKLKLFGDGLLIWLAEGFSAAFRRVGVHWPTTGGWMCDQPLILLLHSL
jgi:hypothetical protein